MKASVVIANFNNTKYINDCINSLNSQTYKDVEIIFHDDNSNDNSIQIIEQFGDVKVIKNKTKTNFGSLNQINAFKKAISQATGEIIFFLDSDDWFDKEKIEKIMKIFLDDKNKMIIFDFPNIVMNETIAPQKKTISFLSTYWGYIHPTSCISIRRKFIEKVFESTVNNNFPNIWLDLRILLYSKYIHSYDVINENLTFYRQSDQNVSSGFKKFTKPWWKRRNEAHEYFFDFMKKNNLDYKKNLDFYVTRLVNKFIK